MKNSVSTGSVITHTPSAAVSSGQMILIGTKVGVAVVDIAANASGSVQMTGVFTIAKAADNVTQGAALYWNNTTKVLTTTASGNTYAGYAIDAAGSGVGTVNININR